MRSLRLTTPTVRPSRQHLHVSNAGSALLQRLNQNVLPEVTYSLNPWWRGGPCFLESGNAARSKRQSIGLRNWANSCNGSRCVKKERDNMLWTICVVLLVLWALGMVTSYTMGGFLHILLIFAVIVLLIRLFQGRGSVV